MSLMSMWTQGPLPFLWVPPTWVRRTFWQIKMQALGPHPALTTPPMHLHCHLAWTDLYPQGLSLPQYHQWCTPPTGSTNSTPNNTGMEGGICNQHASPQPGPYGRTSDVQHDNCHLVIHFGNMETLQSPPTSEGSPSKPPKLLPSSSFLVWATPPNSSCSPRGTIQSAATHHPGAPWPKTPMLGTMRPSIFQPATQSSKKRAALNTPDIQSFFSTQTQQNNDLQPS